MGLLEGKVALITGAGRGQGRSHALALAAEGAVVLACDVPHPMTSLRYDLASRADLDRTVELVTEGGGTCLPVELDVREAASVDSAVETALREFGRLDILLANAGVVSTAPLGAVDDAAWAEMIDTNLTGVFHCLRAAIGPMQRQGYGRIVVTSSMGGRIGIPNLAPYNATKWGVIGMAKSLALEVADQGITVNVVCPCTVATPMVLNESMYLLHGSASTDPESEKLLERFRRVNPIPEPWLQPEDVTRAVMYLVTDPGVVTGFVMEVGLGSSARMH